MTKRHLQIMLIALLVLAMGVLTSCANDTTYSGTMNVVEASKVIEDMASSSNVIVVDARGKEAYDKGHLEGAICISMEEMVVEKGVPNMLPDQAIFEKLMSDKGISNDSVVYVYDDNAGIMAARLWWSMRVYGHQNVMIVNGGATALVKAGGPLSSVTTELPNTEYAAQPVNSAMVATFEEVEAIANAPQEGVKLLDVRSVAEYAEGYIPGAILYPHTQNLYKDGTFMSSRDLGLFYKDAGFSKDDLIIIYCKTSVRATQTAALLEEAGFTNLKVYDGAWLEWSSKVDVQTPVEETAPVGGSDGS